MYTDQSILNWLKDNQPTTKEVVYAQFPKFKTDVIDYHLKKLYPDLLDEALEEEPEKYSKSGKSGRRQIINFVLENPDIKPKKLYENFPDIPEGTLRKYKSEAIIELRSYAEEKSKKSKEAKEEKKEELLANVAKIQESQTQNTVNTSSLNLSKLEEKAYGKKNTEKITEDMEPELDITELAELKIKYLKLSQDIDNILKNSKRDADLEQRVINLEDKTEEIIETKLAELITKKISEFGMNILGKALGNVMGNVNLNTFFSKK